MFFSGKGDCVTVTIVTLQSGINRRVPNSERHNGSLSVCSDAVRCNPVALRFVRVTLRFPFLPDRIFRRLDVKRGDAGENTRSCGVRGAENETSDGNAHCRVTIFEISQHLQPSDIILFTSWLGWEC